MISGRENYARAIEFGHPAYLPCELGVPLTWLVERDEVRLARILELAARFPKDLMPWVDEWGTGWADDGHGAKTDGCPLAGGCIGSTSHSIMPETPLDNIAAMLEAFANLAGHPGPERRRAGGRRAAAHRGVR